MARAQKAPTPAQVAACYSQGMNQRAIARKFKVSQPTISNRMIDAGIERRGPEHWSAGTTSSRWLSDALRKTIAEQYADGDGGRELAERHHVSVGAVYNAARREGVPRRKGCHHGDADSSPGYAAAVNALARELRVAPESLRRQLIKHGLRTYSRPA